MWQPSTVWPTLGPTKKQPASSLLGGRMILLFNDWWVACDECPPLNITKKKVDYIPSFQGPLVGHVKKEATPPKGDHSNTWFHGWSIYDFGIFLMHPIPKHSHRFPSSGPLLCSQHGPFSSWKSSQGTWSITEKVTPEFPQSRKDSEASIWAQMTKGWGAWWWQVWVGKMCMHMFKEYFW